MTKYYKFMVEGVFVTYGDAPNECLGFHSTFHVSAPNVKEAAKVLPRLIEARMARHQVEADLEAIYRPYFWIHDAWESTEKVFSEFSQVDSGFTFFRIGFFESMVLALREYWIRRTNRWLLISMGQADEVGGGCKGVDEQSRY